MRSKAIIRFAIPALAAATFASAAQAAEVQIQAQGPVVELTVSEVVDAQPDIVDLSAGVTSQARTAVEAMRINAREMTAVIDRIKALGIDDNTYVVIVADNGYRHDELRLTPGLTQPLHERKWWLWDGGIRVPYAVTWPGVTKPGTVIKTPVIAKTLAIAGLETVQRFRLDPVNRLARLQPVKLGGLRRPHAAGDASKHGAIIIKAPDRAGMRGQRVVIITAVGEPQETADRVGGQMIIIGKAGIFSAHAGLQC